LIWHFSEYGPTKGTAAGSDVVSPFYLKSDWTVPYHLLNSSIERCLYKLQSELNEVQRSKPFKNWGKKKHDHFMQLVSKPNRLVITADKNLGYCYVTTDWYKAKVLKHLENTSSYENVTCAFNDNDRALLGEIFEALVQFTSEHTVILSEEEFKFILTTKGKKFRPMRFYILAKVHKGVNDPDSIDGRPICPSMTWITHNLSIWISYELGKYIDKAHTVLKDSVDLIHSLKSISNKQTLGSRNKNIFMMTCDVVALYPSIDWGRCMLRISEFLDSVNYEEPEKRRSYLMKAIAFVFENSYIQFEDSVYAQKTGSAMGSSSSPVLANIFMFQTERFLVQRLTDSGMCLLYKRFIDDVFTVIHGSEEDCFKIVEEMNNLDPGIKFTYTTSKKSVEFLDLVVHYDYSKSLFNTSVYQKKLNRYAYLPWLSYHTPAMKKGFIKGEAIRYARLSSLSKDYDVMIQLFIIRLQKRGYPLAFIRKAISQVSWLKREEYLLPKPKRDAIPYLFKVQYNPIFQQHALRHILDDFSKNLKSSMKCLPDKLKQPIIMCFHLPKKLHKHVLLGRKEKNF
jgi:hypothetical protein